MRSARHCSDVWFAVGRRLWLPLVADARVPLSLQRVCRSREWKAAVSSLYYYFVDPCERLSDWGTETQWYALRQTKSVQRRRGRAPSERGVIGKSDDRAPASTPVLSARGAS